MKCEKNSEYANESTITSQQCDIDEKSIYPNQIQSDLIHSKVSPIKFESIEENEHPRKPKTETPIEKSKCQNANKRKKSQKKTVSDDLKLSTSKLNTEIDKKNIKKYKCKVEGCGELVSSSNRGYHNAKHYTRFECDICKAKFPTKSQIRLHILNVHDPTSKKFKCNVCGSSYLTAALLVWHHKLSHLKERNFQCSECGKTFRSKHLLQVHVYCHTGEKPFGCTFKGCTRQFRSKPQRIEHMRSHTGEKPFKCLEVGCDRQFAYAVDFKRHKFNLHGIFTKKFPCQICAEVFPENMILKKHMKKHRIQL